MPQPIETMGMKHTTSTTNLNLILQGRVSDFDLAGVLHLIEAQGMTGHFDVGRYSLDFYAGVIVRASADPIATIAGILDADFGVFRFTKAYGSPCGDLRLNATALLLEAARVRDEAHAQA